MVPTDFRDVVVRGIFPEQRNPSCKPKFQSDGCDMSANWGMPQLGDLLLILAAYSVKHLKAYFFLPGHVRLKIFILCNTAIFIIMAAL